MAVNNKTKGGGVFFAAFWLFSFGAVAETEYEQKVVFDRVSLVIAAENNASPASAMGHSFLKISGNGYEHAFSYYAVLNGAASYLKTLAGKAEGAYVLSPYSQKAAEYLLSENRSLWEFELDLNYAEKRLLKKRVKEKKNKQEAYSFVFHNCNTALENLLSSVNGDFKYHRKKPFTTPVEYAQFLYQAGKIKKISYVRAPAQKKRPVKNILSAAAPSRLAIDTTYIEFSPVYQDLRTVSDAYNSELETKMLSVRFDMQKGRPDKLDLLKLFSVQSVSKYFRVGWESGLSVILNRLEWASSKRASGRAYRKTVFQPMPCQSSASGTAVFLLALKRAAFIAGQIKQSLSFHTKPQRITPVFPLMRG